MYKRKLLEDDEIVTVRNRDNGTVGYTVADLGVHRSFMKNEKKAITMQELRKLLYTPGGAKLLKHYLVVENEDAVKELLGKVEPEYYYTRQDVKNLLQTGSYENLVDCLNFAPRGVINMVKELAVQLKLNDVRKRQAIYEIIGFNVDKAIFVNEESEEDRPMQEKKVRLSDEKKTVVKSIQAPGARLTAPPSYKVVSYDISVGESESTTKKEEVTEKE